MVTAGWRVWAIGYAILAILASGVTTAAVRQLDENVQWDPRVEPLARFVQQERGLEFDHAVEVLFLTNEEFVAEVGGEADDASESETHGTSGEQATRLFRAAGLVSGDVNLDDSGTELVEEGTLALYDPETQRVLVKGTEIDVNLEATLVHELTHALQDQHFDLSRLTDFNTSGEELAFRALGEGDANRIMYAYVDEQGADEREEFAAGEGGIPALDTVPPALVSYFGAPYALGDPFVGLLEEIEGVEGINAAFVDPPVSDEHLLDPFTYVDGDEPVAVDVPELRAGEEMFEEGDWGALTWFLMLSARIDPRVALEAVDGWGGDAYVAFERGGTTCARAAFVGDTDLDTEQMAAALGRWAAAMPAGSASVGRQGGLVEMEACDPGPDATLTFPSGYVAILALPVARNEIIRQALSGGVPAPIARCVGQRFVATTPVDQLTATDTDDVDVDAIFERVQEIVADCRSEQ